MTHRKKLRLDVEELDVEVFATTAQEVKHGTVRGHLNTDDSQISMYTWDPCGTVCGSSCSGPYECECMSPPPV